MTRTFSGFSSVPPLTSRKIPPCHPKSFCSCKISGTFPERISVVYRQEVRTTYLHELGHYLGWDETDMEDHGLA